MFDLFKRNKIGDTLCAPVNGRCIDITEVRHSVFSSKMMGDGFAVIPESNVICAPCTGLLSMVFKTGHAFGITTKDNKQILVHIGIETVNLKGKGFKILKKPNGEVKAGEPIIEISKEEIIYEGYDLTTMVIITSKSEDEFTKNKINQNVCIGDRIIKFKKRDETYETYETN